MNKEKLMSDKNLLRFIVIKILIIDIEVQLLSTPTSGKCLMLCVKKKSLIDLTLDSV